MLYTASDIQNNFGIFNTVYVNIFNHIQHYLGIFMHTEMLWRYIQAYSAPYLTLPYSKPCHILSSGIFRTIGLYKTLWHIDQAYSETCHMALFSHIQTYSEPCAMLTWHTWNPGIFRTPPYLYLNTFLEPYHIYKKLQIFN